MSDDLVKRLRERSRQYVDNEYNLEKRAADRIEQLETANLKQSLITVDHLSRIEKLEAALHMSERRFATLKEDWERLRRRNVPIYGSDALAGEKKDD